MIFVKTLKRTETTNNTQLNGDIVKLKYMSYQHKIYLRWIQIYLRTPLKPS